MNPSELFVEVVRGSSELPPEVRSLAHKAQGIEESCLNESYIQFLDEQIRLSPRGPEWTEILRYRRERLRSFCNVSLISGHIHTDSFFAWIKVDPKLKAVVFWEQLKYNAAN